MKKVLASVFGGAAVLVLLAGCDPRLAEIDSGSQEELWYRQLKSNYSSFTPPPNPAPAAYTPANCGTRTGSNAALPAGDTDNAVDSAADGKAAPAANGGAIPLPLDDDKAAESGKKAPEKDPVTEPQVAAPKDQKAAPEADAQKADAKDADADADGKIYVVKAGDTLGGIAKKFYGKASLEDVIFRANAIVLKDRNTLSIGMRLVIPEL